jgi:hypothetical protein
MYWDYRSVLEGIRDADNGWKTVQGKNRKKEQEVGEATKNTQNGGKI